MRKLRVDMSYLAMSLVLFVVLGMSASPSADAASRADVKAIQTMLNQLGYPSGRPDGAMGRNTRKAIRGYQRDHGLLTDGKASRELREHIEGTVDKRNEAPKKAAARQPSKPKSSALLGGGKSAAPVKSLRKPTVATKPPATKPRGNSASNAKSLGKAVALRAGALHQFPSTRTSRTGQFAAKTRFDIRGRQGLWVDVASETGNLRGWARLGTIRLLTTARGSRVSTTTTTPSQQQSQSSSGFSGLARSLTGWLGGGQSASSSNATSTIGIRGLTRNQLSGNGRPDMAALAQLDRIANPNAARAFASRGGLTEQSVPYPRPRVPDTPVTTDEDEVKD